MIKSLQSLRAIGALMIFTHHFAHQYDLPGVWVEPFGAFPVNWFMILSGFVLCVAFSDRVQSPPTIASIGGFMRRRFIRFAPIYYIGLIFGLLSCIANNSHITLKHILPSVVMLQSWVPIEHVYFGVNAPAWFTSDIFFCYLLFLPMLWLIRKRPVVSGVLFAVIIAIYISLLIVIPAGCRLDQYLFYVVPLTQLPSFMIGMLLWQLFRRVKPLKLSSAGANVLIFTALALACGAIALNGFISQRLALSFYWWIPSAMLIFTLALTDTTNCFASRMLHWRPLVALGNASMIFYLLHRPLVVFAQIAANKSGMNVPLPLIWALALAVMIAVSVAIHRRFYPSRL